MGGWVSGWVATSDIMVGTMDAGARYDDERMGGEYSDMMAGMAAGGIIRR